MARISSYVIEDRRVIRDRTSGEEVPPSPVLRRQGDRPGAGADTPAGPFPSRTTHPAKQEREKQAAIEERDRQRRQEGDAS